MLAPLPVRVPTHLRLAVATTHDQDKVVRGDPPVLLEKVEKGGSAGHEGLRAWGWNGGVGHLRVPHPGRPAQRARNAVGRVEAPGSDGLPQPEGRPRGLETLLDGGQPPAETGSPTRGGRASGARAVTWWSQMPATWRHLRGVAARSETVAVLAPRRG